MFRALSTLFFLMVLFINFTDSRSVNEKPSKKTEHSYMLYKKYIKKIDALITDKNIDKEQLIHGCITLKKNILLDFDLNQQLEQKMVELLLNLIGKILNSTNSKYKSYKKIDSVSRVG